jgi:hypothetical protein
MKANASGKQHLASPSVAIAYVSQIILHMNIHLEYFVFNVGKGPEAEIHFNKTYTYNVMVC